MDYQAPSKLYQEPLSDFIGHLQFDQFATFTTRLPISLASARKIATRVSEFYEDFFWCAEPFELTYGAGNRYHFHALGNSDFHPAEIFKWYQPRYGRCQIIDNTRRGLQWEAARYLAKYVTKKVVDYDFKFGQRFAKRAQLRHDFRDPERG